MVKDLEERRILPHGARVTKATADGLPARARAAPYHRHGYRHSPGSSGDPHRVATEDAVRAALATVNDPEIHRPITELGMVKSVEIAPDGAVAVAVYLTVSGCPMRETITTNVTDGGRRVSRA